MWKRKRKNVPAKRWQKATQAKGKKCIKIVSWKKESRFSMQCNAMHWTYHTNSRLLCALLFSVASLDLLNLSQITSTFNVVKCNFELWCESAQLAHKHDIQYFIYTKPVASFYEYKRTKSVRGTRSKCNIFFCYWTLNCKNLSEKNEKKKFHTRKMWHSGFYELHLKNGNGCHGD